MPCPENAKGKSLGHRVIDTLVFAAAVTFVVYVIIGIAKFIFKPVTWLWASDEELDGGRKQQEATDAISARSARRAALADDSSDPMYQYIERFVESPGEYLGDPANDGFQRWYERFNRGEIMDSEMRWAPEVYDEDHRISTRFLKYLEVQVNLHRGHLRDSSKFLGTIRTFYPEFEPKFSSIIEAINGLRERNAKIAKRLAMTEELEKAGIPESVALTLGSMGLSREDLRERLTLAKQWVAPGYDAEVVRVMVINDVHDAAVVEQASILHSISVDPQLAVDMLNGKLAMSDIRKVEEFASNFRDIMGEAAFVPAREDPSKTMLQVAVELEVQKVRRAHRRTVRDAAWRQS